MIKAFITSVPEPNILLIDSVFDDQILFLRNSLIAHNYFTQLCTASLVRY